MGKLEMSLAARSQELELIAATQSMVATLVAEVKDLRGDIENQSLQDSSNLFNDDAIQAGIIIGAWVERKGFDPYWKDKSLRTGVQNSIKSLVRQEHSLKDVVQMLKRQIERQADQCDDC